MFTVQKKIGNIYTFVSGKYQFGDLEHAKKKAEKIANNSNNPIFWKKVSRTNHWYGYDSNNIINFRIRKRASNPQGKKKMAKKKRSAKQLANDKRLGRMAKKRAAAKRGGARKKVARKKVTKRKANPKTNKAKSHLWVLFQCSGNKVRFMRFTGTGSVNFTSDKGKAILFQTKKDAAFGAQSAKILRDWNLGIASYDSTKAQIIASCQPEK